MLTIFSLRLKEILEEKKMTVYRLSKKTGISQSTLSRYINGERQPLFQNVVAIANTLGVGLDYFRE